MGASGDGKTDVYTYFQKAIDSCAKTGKSLYIPSGIYIISKTLELKDGVNIIGENVGNNPLQSPEKGTIIQYTGTENAITILGHNVSLSNLHIVDKSNGKATGGILLHATNRLIENDVCKQIQIYGFTNGYGLLLKAEKQGGICYTSFYDLSIRHAKIGIEIESDTSSFVNSNTFFHGVISGGGYDVGIWTKGGNNNQFYGVCIEPYSSKNSHILIEKGEIQCENIRIEGNKQDPSIPLVKFGKNTRKSHINGLFSGGKILDLGDNSVALKDAKMTSFSTQTINAFENPYFSTSSEELTIPSWNIKSNVKVPFKILKSEVIDGFNVVAFYLPPNTSLSFTPSTFQKNQNRLYKEVTFGFYVQTMKQHAVYTTIQAPKGMATSYYHSGSGEWEFIGMNAIIDTIMFPNPTLHLENNSSDTSVFKVTTPVCNFGNHPLQLTYSALEAKGGIINGMLNQTLNTLKISENGILEIPSSSNYFELTNVGEIKQIHGKDSKIPRGTVISLLFNQAGVQLHPSDKLELKETFISSKFGSITLISLGNESWREVNRN